MKHAVWRSPWPMLALGLAIGFLAGRLYADSSANETATRSAVASKQNHRAAAGPHTRDVALNAETTPPKASPSERDAVVIADHPPAVPGTNVLDPPLPVPATGPKLNAELAAAREARLRLSAELEAVKRDLDTLASQVDSLLAARDEAEEESEREARAAQVDADSLVEAGFDPDEASFIAERWGEQEMALLNLRDRAVREGWNDSDRFTDAARELRTGKGSLRRELDEETYDRFLFSTGRANRVVVGGVIESSPARAIGLEQGDVIYRYDGERVFSGRDLRTAITSSDGELPVTLEVERDGVLLDFEIDRGPIGIRLDSQSVEP